MKSVRSILKRWDMCREQNIEKMRNKDIENMRDAEKIQVTKFSDNFLCK